MKSHRKNKSFLENWWWTVDRVTLIALTIIIVFSGIMVATASPAVAERIGVESFYFVRRQLVYLVMALFIMGGVSLLSPVAVRRLAILGFAVGLLLLVAVLIFGAEVKGSRRWLSLGGFTLQPSEFIKPFFAVVTGWVLSQRYERQHFPSFKISIMLYSILAGLLILQPDFGMTVTVSAMWGGQLFLAGISMLWVGVVAVLSVVGAAGAFLLLPHVRQRIMSFIDPAPGENYQVRRSLQAFQEGGLYGRGPGEGTVKQVLPDSHTDFIFAVVGEEMGTIVCLLVVALFAVIVLRGLSRMLKENDLFIVYSVAGLLLQFGMQAVINIGVTLHLLPTKGMTLPFISYGGSSMLAISVAMGMMLALTRRRYGLINVNTFGTKTLNLGN